MNLNQWNNKTVNQHVFFFKEIHGMVYFLSKHHNKFRSKTPTQPFSDFNIQDTDGAGQLADPQQAEEGCIDFDGHREAQDLRTVRRAGVPVGSAA